MKNKIFNKKNTKLSFLILTITCAIIFFGNVKNVYASCDSDCAASLNCSGADAATTTCTEIKYNACYNNCNSSAATSTTTSTAVTSTSGSTNFTNPLAFTTVEGLLGGILSAIQKIIVTLALVFIAIGAVMILVSAGTPEMVERGKKAITMALIGLSLGIAAPSILKELAGFLGWGTTTDASVNAAMSLSQIALRVLNFLLGITGVLALIMLVIGGFMYLTSAGDEERIDSGKKIFKSALIGVIIVLASMVLVRQIALFFSVG